MMMVTALLKLLHLTMVRNRTRKVSTRYTRFTPNLPRRFLFHRSRTNRRRRFQPFLNRCNNVVNRLRKNNVSGRVIVNSKGLLGRYIRDTKVRRGTKIRNLFSDEGRIRIQLPMTLGHVVQQCAINGRVNRTRYTLGT